MFEKSYGGGGTGVSNLFTCIASGEVSISFSMLRIETISEEEKIPIDFDISAWMVRTGRLIERYPKHSMFGISRRIRISRVSCEQINNSLNSLVVHGFVCKSRKSS